MNLNRLWRKAFWRNLNANQATKEASRSEQTTEATSGEVPYQGVGRHGPNNIFRKYNSY